MGLYSLVAWPPDPVARWLREVQGRYGLASYGAPHLNLRTPFEYDGDEGTLIDATSQALAGLEPFRVSFRAWRLFPHTILLELRPSPQLLDAHARVVRGLGVPPTDRDCDGFLPHLTLALGVCPWAVDDIWRQVSQLEPPQDEWTISACALTLESRGEIVELARYPLSAQSPAAASTPEAR